MAFENDPEGYQIAVRYAGRDFDKPRMVTCEPIVEFSFSYTLSDFHKIIFDVAATIPDKCRASAKVELIMDLYDGDSKFVISYMEPETPEMVADRVNDCIQYVAERRKNERHTYEALKRKFESPTSS